MSFLSRWFRLRPRVGAACRCRPRLEALEDRTLLTSYTVTTTNDVATPGQVSLRDVITAINTQPPAGVNTIDFDIGKAGSVQTIDLTSPLPPLTQPVFLDGWSQGVGRYAGPPLIVLNGAGAGAAANGLTFDAGSDGSTVRGLVIQQFSANGIEIDGASGITVSGNYLGTDVKGTTPLGNGRDAILIDGGSTNNVVGGTAHDAGNVICGSFTAPPGGVAGTQAATFSLSPAVITGNLASFNVTLTYNDTAADEMVYVGVDIRNSDPALAPVGTSGQPDYSAFNFIPSSTIGTGWETVANAFSGEFLFQTPPAAGGTPNGLAPNASYFIGTLTYNLATFGITPSPALSVSIAGIDTVFGAEQPNKPQTFNFVNPNFAPGTQPLVNSPAAVTTTGIEIAGSGTTGNQVIGNLIGTDPTGTSIVGQLTDDVLIDDGATGTTVGGMARAAGNVLAGGDNGIVLSGAGTDSNHVVGNRIGTGKAGTQHLGNTVVGVLLENGAAGNTVGGATAGSTNLIAFNGKGIVVGNSAADTTTVHDTLLGNRIYGNAVAAIELGNQGPTANGANPRSYPNNGQNTPVLTDITAHGVRGSLSSVANTGFRLEFFAETVGRAAPTQRVLGFLNVTTDAAGNANFTFPLRSLPLGEVVTATATNLSSGDTSELAPIGTEVIILSNPRLVLSGTTQRVSVRVEVLTANGPATTGEVQVTIPGLTGQTTEPLKGKPVTTLVLTVPPGLNVKPYLVIATALNPDDKPAGTATAVLTIGAGVSRRWNR